VLGLLDDAILIPLGIWAFTRMAPPEIYERSLAVARQAALRPVSKAGGAAILLIWLALLLWLVWWLNR
jgi:hypothetical protein